MTRYLLLSALTLAPLLGLAQSSSASNDNPALLNGNFNLSVFAVRDAGVMNSPMLYPGWRLADVQFTGRARPVRLPLKYDLVRQELRLRRTQGDSVLADATTVPAFRWAEGLPGTFVTAAWPEADLAGAYAEVLFDSPQVQVLKFQRKTMSQEASANSSFSTTSGVSRLQDEVRLYLRYPADKGRLAAVKLRRASLVQALAGYATAQQAVEAGKGNFANEAALVEVVRGVAPMLTAPAGK